jgi:leucine dehydrogenase
MTPFDAPEFDDHEEVSFVHDPDSGLRAIIAIHTTAPFGLSGGGCRVWPYETSEAALRDALRLSTAMSYKLALTDMPAGGAKTVVIGDAAEKTEALLLALGRAVDRLGGRYIIAEDVGTTAEDMQTIGQATRYVTGRRHDTSANTADGVLVGLKTAVRRRLGKEDLVGLRVAVEGLGQVGRRLCEGLRAGGASLIVSDIDMAKAAETAKELGATAVAPDAILGVECDVVAPCALGGTLDERAVEALRCRVVAGAANNQLARPELADALSARSILYAPDFVINAGGVIGAAFEGIDPGAGGDDARGEEQARVATDRVGDLLTEVFERAELRSLSTHAAAVLFAKEKIRARRKSFIDASAREAREPSEADDPARSSGGHRPLR